MKKNIAPKKLLLCLIILCISLNAAQPSNGNTLNQLVQKTPWLPENPLRLHLGCGERYFPGYINIDYPATEHTVQKTSCADVLANITELQFPNGTVDEVRSHHVFEHFTRQEALALLCAWHSWLQVGGIVVIETPDFDASMHQLVSSEYSYQEKQAILRHVFGSHEAKWAIHCDGWYKAKFEHVLITLGFEIVSIHQESYLLTRNVFVVARKKINFDADTLALRAKDILRESLICDSETEMLKIWQTDFEHAFKQMILN